MSILKDCFPTVAIAATAYCFLYYYPFSDYKICKNEQILMFQLFRDKLDLLNKVSIISKWSYYLSGVEVSSLLNEDECLFVQMSKFGRTLMLTNMIPWSKTKEQMKKPPM